ncbi:uncharacterized protein LOC136086117 [Hydra vulgaris]|uniref:Uncharacterized protein LOC136086117 n=1 Tax=Hydra vulgaris TaxID=6087 RepID=A0ABM4CRF0_HYDVU
MKINEISCHLEQLKLPSECNRQPRSLKELKMWQATEFKQFLLYTGPVVLKGILTRDSYRNFISFSIAIRITCYKEVERRTALLPYAKELLEWFVFNAKDFYGRTFSTYNTHSLIHIHEDVMNHGEDLISMSAFKFENHMQVLKHFIRNANSPLVQVIKRSRVRECKRIN